MTDHRIKNIIKAGLGIAKNRIRIDRRIKGGKPMLDIQALDLINEKSSISVVRVFEAIRSKLPAYYHIEFRTLDCAFWTPWPQVNTE